MKSALEKNLLDPGSRLLKNLTRRNTLVLFGFLLKLSAAPLKLTGFSFGSIKNLVESRVFFLVKFFMNLDSGSERIFYLTSVYRVFIFFI